MEEVNILPSVRLMLDELVEILYDEEYFGFLDSCYNYLDNIYNFIDTIPTLKKKPTKRNKYGKWYCAYKHNSKTTWYITFDVEDGVYLVTHITNNHTTDYPKYIRGLK